MNTEPDSDQDHPMINTMNFTSIDFETANYSRVSIKHPGDVGMIHHRQRLALGLEARDDRLGVHHPKLQDHPDQPVPASLTP